MATSPPWYRIAGDRRVLRRAVFTSFGVGTTLTVVNRWDEIFNGGMTPTSALPVVITYAIPFIVSLASSVIAVRVERRDASAASNLLEHEIRAINKFPDQNPNPVLRITEGGQMTYANPAASGALAALGVAPDGSLAPATAARLRDAAAEDPPGVVEVEHDGRTLAVLTVHVPELGVYNLYCTDVTAAKALERFPDRNPNPVLRMTPDGALRYANEASAPITRALGTKVGGRMSPDTVAALQRALDAPGQAGAEIAGEGRTYRLDPVAVPEFGVVNIYGTDITATVAINKFPNHNPNPVLRFSRSGRMTYANPASELVRKALGAQVGDDLDPEMLARVEAALEDHDDPTMEVETDGTIYRLRVVSVYEFDSINLYGTDITAVREVETLSRANESLLLNILPPSIAERLRSAESPIADRFDDMAVLFADVVDFTALSARLSPNEVVSILGEVFSACDRLADRLHLEKIKTVGDAYMVVGGLQEVYGFERHVHENHAFDVAEMGIAIIDEVGRLGREWGTPLQIRVGMHIGPAVAGVIGLKKFIYDVWGDTVNTASRMESTGVPGRLQVTRETADRLATAFEVERRGMVEVKGKGTVETWFVHRRRSPAPGRGS